ncbi:MAG: hypothetical protein BGO29_14750 [Bacteroidales bacterium 36-12]|nr:MAG: hypothetical protein BGO29_14750 [Bacteroidales bacterium 36-12]
MKIATYNLRIIKGDDIKKGRGLLLRFPRILKNIKKVDADVIAFQEVQTPHLWLLKLFLRGYNFHYAPFRDDGIFHGGNLIAWKKELLTQWKDIIQVPSKRDVPVVRVHFGEYSISFASIHLSLVEDKMEDIKEIVTYPYGNIKRAILGDFNIPAEEEDNIVFKYLEDNQFTKLNKDLTGYHGYGYKEPATPDNIFVNFGNMYDINVIGDNKASDHNLMYVTII